MVTNGYTDQKETSDERFVRYLADFRRRHDTAKREKYTGELTLTIGLQDGNAVRREIHTKDMTK